jgi:hypothetical protein
VLRDGLLALSAAAGLVVMSGVAAVLRDGLLALSAAAGLVVMQQMLTAELDRR